MADYTPDIMIYHANCADGFGAAWAAWMKWGDAVEYVPCAYGQPVPSGLAGKHVLIGDFSFKRDVMEAIAAEAASIIVLDHHETAEAELQPWRVFAALCSKRTKACGLHSAAPMKERERD